MRHNFLLLVESILYLIIGHNVFENTDTLGGVVTSSLKYSISTGSGRCLEILPPVRWGLSDNQTAFYILVTNCTEGIILFIWLSW